MRRLTSYVASSVFALALCAGASVAAQTQNAVVAARADAERAEVNHDVQLYLLAASNEPGGGGNVPQAVEGALKQLRATLPFSNYRLATSFLNRVRDGGTVEVSGVGGAPLVANPPNSVSPAFFKFSLHRVRLLAGADAQPFIQVEKLYFGLKVPVQTASVGGEGGKPSYPVIQYQDTGISTEMSVREGTPTVVGTMTSSQPGESYVLVMTLKRAATR